MARRIDPKIQFLLLLFLGCIILISGTQQLLMLNVLAGLYLLYNQHYMGAVKLFCLLLILYVLNMYVSATTYQFFKYLGLFVFLILRISPVIAFASVLQEVPSGKLISSLQQLGIPRNILITLAVTLRFFPIIKKENQTIQSSAQLRGLSFKQSRNWLHPLNSFEYSFVPLMMRTLKITDELAASAMTKGIDSPQKRTSIYDNRLRVSDYLIAGCVIAGSLFILGIKM
ncbi:energy-coupling factor transporter transmembrane component T [Enterococcus sp. DIV0876]|uniref:energy-coupling factor transporter transmembrane component T n=1 Tax=Enterococcus sp. DIV0876 TaxID=2774633 RepID=UPI003D2FF15F